MDEAINCIKEHKRELDDLDFVLMPKKYSDFILKSAQYPACSECRISVEEIRKVISKSTLILFHADDDREQVVGLYFFGPVKEKNWLNEITQKQEYTSIFDMWLGGEPFDCLFGAMIRVSHPDKAINRLVLQLLDNLLITGRPLRRYNCTFFLPLDLMKCSEIDKSNWKFQEVSDTFAERHLIHPEITPKEEDSEKKIEAQVIHPGTKPKKVYSEKEIEAQAYHYFIPHLRSVIYETRIDSKSAPSIEKTENLQPLQHWRLVNTKDLQLSLAREAKEPLGAPVKEVALYRYFNGLYCFAVRVELPPINNSSLNSDQDDWWRDLFYASKEDFKSIQDRQIAEWLRYTKLVRLLYHTFPEQRAEKKIDAVTLTIENIDPNLQKREIVFNKTTALNVTHHIGEVVSPVGMELLAYFFAWHKDDIEEVKRELILRLDHIPDDRMFVNTAYGLAGASPRIGDNNAWNQHERLFSLALFVDTPSDTFKELNSWNYDEEFVRDQIKELSCDRWRGLGTRSGYTDYSNVHFGYKEYFNDTILPNHVPYIYGRMLLLAVFYKTSLRHYQRWVTLATEDLINGRQTGERVDLYKTRRKFIEFTNNYWFREITSQMQGKEIFNKQVAALGLEKEYDLLKEEMERADEFVKSDRQAKLNQYMTLLAIVGALLALISLFVTGMQVKDGEMNFECAWTTVLTGAGVIFFGWVYYIFRR